MAGPRFLEDTGLTVRTTTVVFVRGGDLRIEPDLARWMPLWGAPGL
jgi:hypothetical protein